MVAAPVARAFKHKRCSYSFTGTIDTKPGGLTKLTVTGVYSR